jgi:MHS family proline/betaine transporter-like MFS transporter
MSVSVALPAATRYVAPRWLQMAAATVGNALETFDILIYGFLAVTLSGVFFPARNLTISLLLFFSSFGLPYVVRPGSGCFGRLCRSSRPARKALTVSIRLMMAGTAIIAVMPPFASIGVVAPIGVFVARVLQAFSFSGEVGSAMAEQTKVRKGFYASWQSASQKVGSLLGGSVFCTVVLLAHITRYS